MTYDQLLRNAPLHDTPAFLDYLREHNEVLYETDQWLVIKNVKYGWPTAFAVVENPALGPLMVRYGEYEWRVKPKSKRTVIRFHIHILAGGDNSKQG